MPCLSRSRARGESAAPRRVRARLGSDERARASGKEDQAASEPTFFHWRWGPRPQSDLPLAPRLGFTVLGSARHPSAAGALGGPVWPQALSVVEQQVDGGRQRPPRIGLLLELLPSFSRQLVVLRAAVVVREIPLRLDPTAPLEAVQRRIQRSLIDLQRVFRDLLDPLGDRPSVLRIESYGVVGQEVERPLRQRQTLVRWRRIGHSALPFGFDKSLRDLMSKRKEKESPISDRRLPIYFRGPKCGTGLPTSSAPRSGALPVKPSLTFGSATPRSTAAEPGFTRKSKSSALYTFCTVFASCASSFETLAKTS